MQIEKLPLQGAYLIQREAVKDHRGELLRQYSTVDFAEFGLEFEIKQSLISKNNKAHVLRGLHYQITPFSEIKVVTVLKGKIFDVMLDIRPESKTYLQSYTLELSDYSNTMLYVPKGIAHGFQTLEDNTEVYYLLSEVFMPEYYRGIRWDDPLFNIKWPECENRIISERDKNYKNYKK